MNWPRVDVSDGRGVAYAGLVVGIVVSVAGNVAHAYVPAPDAPDGWSPSAGLVLSAVVWPLILFLAVELMLRVPWPSAWYFSAIRWGGLSVVAFVAGYISYQHLSELLVYWGEGRLTTAVGPVTLNAADLGPFAVDGLLVLSAGALWALALRRQADNVDAPVVVAGVLPTRQDARPVGGRRVAPVVRPSAASTDLPAGSNARLVYDALPGTVAELVDRTRVKRTTVSYALTRTLTSRVVQGADKVWRRTDASASVDGEAVR